MDVGVAIRYSFLIFAFLLTVACGESENTRTTQPTNKPTGLKCSADKIPDQFIIRWKDGSITVKKSADLAFLEESLVGLAADQNVDYIESDYRLRIQGAPTAQIVGTTSQSLNSWGQMRIYADKAWARTKGNGVIVAVVDAGVDVNHPQLRNQLALNLGEIPGNKVDEDKNGLIDDYVGYDFEAGNGNIHDAPDSTHHGSHVAGVILAEHLNDGSGIKGVAPEAKLLPLNFMDNIGNGSVSDAVAAINYAVKRGAKIINASWGAEVCSRSLQETVASLEGQGVLFIAASGNGDFFQIGYNIDYRPTFPAAYPFSGQITVGAMDEQNILAGFSNYSPNLVHLLAPGLGVWSTVYDDGKSTNHGYLSMSGTSMAAPFVSGAAALLWSFRPKATVQQIKQALLESVTVGEPKFPVVTGGYLNVDLALDKLAALVEP